MIPSSSRGEVSWTDLQLLQGPTLIQLSLCLQNLVHVLCELCIEALGDLARLADYDFSVSFNFTPSCGGPIGQHEERFRLTPATLDDNVVEGMLLRESNQLR